MALLISFHTILNLNIFNKLCITKRKKASALVDIRIFKVRYFEVTNKTCPGERKEDSQGH